MHSLHTCSSCTALHREKYVDQFGNGLVGPRPKRIGGRTESVYVGDLLECACTMITGTFSISNGFYYTKLGDLVVMCINSE